MKFLLIILLSFLFLQLFYSASVGQSYPNSPQQNSFTYSHGGIIRGDSTKKEIAFVFTRDSFADDIITDEITLKLGVKHQPLIM
ncbi:MAG: hypothetical protein A2V93_09735 [Ignavibacteria bacterium RBG_16_34_14]|nr:MAG: hypothetical protein A2V93_09735 [Ignavibacteria bacterium RBG_16_34_14]